MTIERTFADLTNALVNARDGVRAVHTAVVEDRPGDGTSVVDSLEAGLEDLLGLLQEELAAARECEQSLDGEAELLRTRRSLADCHRNQLRAGRVLHDDLLRHDRVAPLIRLARERGGAWRAWTTVVRRSLDECRAAMYAVDDTLVDGWEALAERAGIGGISVRAVGQQISLAEPGRLLDMGLP